MKAKLILGCALLNLFGSMSAAEPTAGCYGIIGMEVLDPKAPSSLPRPVYLPELKQSDCNLNNMDRWHKEGRYKEHKYVLWLSEHDLKIYGIAKPAATPEAPKTIKPLAPCTPRAVASCPSTAIARAKGMSFAQLNQDSTGRLVYTGEVEGAQIIRTSPCGVFESGGIRQCDVILRVNDKPIAENQAGNDLLFAVQEGRTSKVEVWRQGQKLKFDFK